jgi:tetratricopeptide (TPR) repeat protein
MFMSRPLAAWRSVAAAVVFGSLLTLSGCEVTFAGKSREEGKRLFSERMYEDAAGAFRNAIKQDPRDYHSHFYLGVCYDELKQHQQAFEQYYAAREIMGHTNEGRADEDNFRLVILDTIASAIARNDDREMELSRAEKRARETNTAEDWFLLAKVYRLKGDADLAIDAYRRAAHWDINSFAIRREVGLYLLDPLNQRKDAEYYLRQAYRLNPNDEAVNNALDRLGVVPLPAYEAKQPEYAPPLPYKGPLPSAMQKEPVPSGVPLKNGNATTAEP